MGCGGRVVSPSPPDVMVVGGEDAPKALPKLMCTQNSDCSKSRNWGQPHRVLPALSAGTVTWMRAMPVFVSPPP